MRKILEPRRLLDPFGHPRARRSTSRKNTFLETKHFSSKIRRNIWILRYLKSKNRQSCIKCDVTLTRRGATDTIIGRMEVKHA